jgi:hypothetical protein
MSNAIGGINLQLIAQDSLSTLLAEFPLINKFTTNFGGEIATRGETVATRIASPVTQITDIGANGYAVTDVESLERKITLNKHKGFVMGFSDGEVAKGGYDVLRRTFIRPAANAVSKAVLDDIFSLVTAAHYPQAAAFDGSIAAFDADAVAGISQSLTDRNVPQANRILVVRPALYTSLARDNAIQAQYASGTNAPLTENLLPRIHGFEVNQYTGLPNGTTKLPDGVTNAFPDLDARLMGVACTPESIIIATRQPALPTNWYGNVASATDEKSGLTVQVREWYDGDTGKQKISMSILYGVQIGSIGTLGRILAS